MSRWAALTLGFLLACDGSDSPREQVDAAPSESDAADVDASGGDPLDAAVFDAAPADAAAIDAGPMDGGSGPDASWADAGQADAGATGMVVDTVFVDGTFTQVHQGATFELVITGSGLEGVTDVTVAGGGMVDPAGLVVTPTQVRAPMSVLGAAVPGPRDVTVTGDAGVLTEADAFEVTPVVLAPAAVPGGRATYESPILLREVVPWSVAGATLLFLAGEHRSDVAFEMQGVTLVGQGSGATVIRGDTSGFGGVYFESGAAAIRGLTIVSPLTPSVVGRGLSTLSIDDVALVGGGINVSPGTPNRTETTVTNLSHDAQGTGATGLELDARGKSSNIASISNSRFTGCGTGISMGNGSLAVTTTTIEGCDLGVQIGEPDGRPRANVEVTASQLLDNTTGILHRSGTLTVTDTVIADIEATARPSRVAIDVIDGQVFVTGGEIRGQDWAGVHISGCPDLGFDVSFWVTLDRVLIVGGEVGVLSGGCPDVGSIDLRSSIVRDQTVASVRMLRQWVFLSMGNEGGTIPGNQLSVVSGFALDDVRDPSIEPWGLIEASGTTLNGRSYRAVVEGPASVPPDYRLVGLEGAIQF